MKHFDYDGVRYSTETDLRTAIWFKERKILPENMSASDWGEHKVAILDDVDSGLYVEPRDPGLSELQLVKLGQLEEAFNRYRNSSDTFLVSSLGFRVNANVAAYNNVSSLVVQLEHKASAGGDVMPVGFMDFDDNLRQVGLEELKTLQYEISANNSGCYSQKWGLREQIKSAESAEALSAIELVFIPTEFLIPEEQ